MEERVMKKLLIIISAILVMFLPQGFAMAEVRVEAENMTLGGYKVDVTGHSWFSGGKVIRVSTTDGTGTATYTFEGADGRYRFRIGYVDESDGAGMLSLFIGETLISMWALNEDLADATDTSSYTVKDLTGIALKQGDVISIIGKADQGEYARIDFIDILEDDVETVSITLAWDANTESDLAGYKVYYGNNKDLSDAEAVDVKNVTELLVTGLTPGIFYYAVTAYDTEGLESGLSNKVFSSFVVVSPPEAQVEPENEPPSVPGNLRIKEIAEQ
jgi:hypothetical protein